MKKIITSILLMLFMGCESNSLEATTEIVNECIECFGDYHFDENGFCVCD